MSGDLNPSVGNISRFCHMTEWKQAGLARTDASRKTQEILPYTIQNMLCQGTCSV